MREAIKHEELEWIWKGQVPHFIIRSRLVLLAFDCIILR